MKTSKRDFESFQRYCHLWADRFGLLDWQIRYEHRSHNRDGRKFFATTDAHPHSRLAVVALSVSWPGLTVTAERLDSTALHEILHIVLAEMEEVAWERFVSEAEYNAAREISIVRLENAIFRMRVKR